jgi:chromosomal replication initiator protein
VSSGHVWRTALEQLRREMTRAQFDTWLRGTQLAEMGEDGSAVLRVRTTFARELLETRFRERIEAAISQVTGRSCRLRVVVGEAQPEEADAAVPPAPLAASHRTRVAAEDAPRQHAAAAAYNGPSLFGAPVDEETHDDPAEPVPASVRRHAPVIAARRRRMAGGGGRVPPSAGRMRAAAAGRASASAGSLVSVETPDEGDPTHALVPAAQATPSEPMAPPLDTDDAARAGEPARRRAGGRHDESDGYRGMSESSDPRGSGGSAPAPRLNPRYTFNTFIVGSGNQLAHAASQAVAEAPGQAYNPLFLYGGVGLGKTHLLHAIGHKALEMSLTVLYVSSETFTNEIINAIRYRTTEEFRDKYRSVDVLLVDDIQFIAGKESTEEEFFHTFNSLYEMSKQIVICSDRPPKAIVSLEERLRSRFEWGLIADIQPPDLETRVAILRAKADMMNRRVPDDVMSYLAGQVHSNIRELEGSFNRLLAFSQLQGLPLTIETAKSALANIASDGRQRRVSVAEVLAAVAGYYRIPEDDLRGKQRDKHIVVPRQVAMYLMRQETEASLLEIGQSLGGRDHSTVLHGYDKIAREMNENTALRKEVLAIRQQLLG